MVAAAHVDKLARQVFPFVLFCRLRFCERLISASCWQGFGWQRGMEG